MSKSHPDRADELGDLFVSVTGDATVTERQEESTGNRELPERERVSLEDGLDDAVGDEPDIDTDGV